MYHRSYGRLAALSTAALLVAGCAQATRHSNTMVFGTSTSLALKVGSDARQVPTILFGYDRQEAVVLPLVANTSEAPGTANRLSPCDVRVAVAVNGESSNPIHPCLLVATNREATDAYSVLASFGAEFGAKGSGASPEASGGLAQYFATGMAAQLLAATGGASVVNTKADSNGAADGIAVAALFGTDEQRSRATISAYDYRVFKAALKAKIDSESVDATMFSRLQAFETRVNAKSRLSGRCQTIATCSGILADAGETPFDNLFANKGAKLTAELGNWDK